MKKVNGKLALSFVVLMAMLVFSSCGSKTNSSQGESSTAAEQEGPYTVAVVDAENGSYTISPEIPADSLVAAGTELTITVTPASGYSLDCIYYTVKGGMWGTTSYESFSPEQKITVGKDMTIGATFVENALVENINVTHDVVYAKPGVKTLKYDVFSPKGAKNLPCVVIVHGGGWASNNEDVMRGLARELVKGNQYVVFSIDYRWLNTADGDEIPTSMCNIIEDVYGAIAHIQEHAAEYGADATRIAVTGDSAGGHLSASAANMTESIGDGGFGVQEGIYDFMPTYMPEGKTADQVRAEITSAIQVAAPSYGVFTANMLAGRADTTSQASIDAICPIAYVDDLGNRQVPQLLLRGTEDRLISDEEVQTYTDALNAAGQKVEYIQVEGAGHAFFDWKPDARTMGTFAQYGVPYAAKMKSFFDEVFYK